jgi:hypothetical protein
VDPFFLSSRIHTAVDGGIGTLIVQPLAQAFHCCVSDANRKGVEPVASVAQDSWRGVQKS